MKIRFNNHIAFFLPSLAGGGAEKVFLHLAREFCSCGIALDVVLGRAMGEYLEDLPRDARVIDLKVHHMAASVVGLSRYLHKERPDALLAGLPIANLVAVLSKKISCSRTRIVTCLHCVESQAIQLGPFAKRHLMQVLYPRIIPDADAIIAVTQGVADDFMKMTARVSRNRIKVIYNPIVDHQLYAMAGEAITEPWFPMCKMPVVLAVGRLSAVKDFGTLIRAFNLVRKKTSAKLIILGEGEERAKLEGLVNELNLSDDIYMPGFVDNPYKYMRHASVLVLSSLRESFGNVLVEAMACGCPVVSTDCPVGPAEILEGGRWGCMVPVGDCGALSEAIIKIISKERATQVSKRVEDFSTEIIAQQYLKVMESVS